MRGSFIQRFNPPITHLMMPGFLSTRSCPVRRQRTVPLMVSLIGLAWPVQTYSAQKPNAITPPALRRVVHRFDFDERPLGNFESVPMHWDKMHNEDFPRFTKGAFDARVGHDAPPSFYLNTNGRNVAYWFRGPSSAVNPDSEYLIAGYIRPDRLAGARAALSAFYVDRQRLPIAGTQVFSQLVGGASNAETWHRVEIPLGPAPPQAATVGLTAWVAQQSTWDPRKRPHRHVELPDIDAGAWFDDIVIYRMPSVRLEVPAPGNVFVAPDHPVLETLVVDADAEGLLADLFVYDAAGKQVHQQDIPILTTAPDTPSSIQLDNLPPGLYRAVLQVTAGQDTTLPRSVTFAQLAASTHPNIGAARRFGVVLDPKIPVEPGTVGPLLNVLGVGAVKVPLWGAPTLQTGASLGAWDDMLTGLVRTRVNLTAVFAAPPAELVESAGPYARTLLDILAEDPQGWRAHLGKVVAPYASIFRSWQLGADGDRSMLGNSDLAAAQQNFRRELVDLLTTVYLTTPAQAGTTAQSQSSAAEEISVLIDADIQEAWIPAYLDQYRPLDYQAVSAYVETDADVAYARLPSLSRFAKRIIRTRHAGATTTYVPQPWKTRVGNTAITVEPTEAYIVYRTLVDLLGDLQPGPELKLGPDIRALAFHDVESSVLAIWDTQAGQLGRLHALHLGPAASQVDLWGRSTRLTVGSDGGLSLRLYPQPTYLTGVERWVVDFLAGVTIDPTMAEPSLVPQTHTVTLTNTGTTSISGQVALEPPSGWVVKPPRYNFHIGPRSEFEQVLQIRYGQNDPAGTKLLRAMVSFDNQGSLSLELPLAIELGIEDVDVWGFALLEGDTLVLRHGITNRSSRTLSFRSFAAAPGRSRQFRVISALAPGQTTTAEYHFKNANAFTGRTVRLGLKELGGPRHHTIDLVGP